jgi:hypothetical protein
MRAGRRIDDVRAIVDSPARAHPGDRFLCVDRDGHEWRRLGDAATAPFGQRVVDVCDRCGLAVEYQVQR